MRFREFKNSLFEDGDDMPALDTDTDSETGLSDHLTNGEDPEIISLLKAQLEHLRGEAEFKGITKPRITVTALVNFVNQEGHSAFTSELLANALKSDTLTNIVDGAPKEDEVGVKQVYIKPLIGGEEEGDSDGNSEKVGNEKTVSSMASRALGKR